MFTVFGGLYAEAPAPPPSKTAVKFLLLPFKINSAVDLTYLREGIGDMLNSRLSSNRTVVLQGSGGTPGMRPPDSNHSEKAAADLAHRMGADYAVGGSLTVIGEQFSIDAACIASTTGDAVVQFRKTGTALKEVIGAVDEFAEKIKQNTFATAVSSEASGVTPVATDSGRGLTFSHWRSMDFDGPLSGIDVGDVNGDGRNELVAISEKTATVYRLRNHSFERTGVIPEKMRNDYFDVFVGDTNGNGRAEIFLSQWAVTGLPQVVVYEFDGGRYTRIAELSNWFVRTMAIPGAAGKRLVGQQKKGNAFAKDIYAFKWQEKRLVRNHPLALPRGTTVHGFAWAPLSNPDRSGIILLTAEDNLAVYTTIDRPVWTSSEHYGGTTVFFDHDAVGGSSEIPGRTYLKPCIGVADFNGDGIAEVVVQDNTDFAGRIFQRIRYYNSGRLKVFASAGNGLQEVWHTDNVSGHIVNAVIGDIDADGQPEILAAVMPKKNKLMQEEAGYVEVLIPRQGPLHGAAD